MSLSFNVALLAPVLILSACSNNRPAEENQSQEQTADAGATPDGGLREQLDAAIGPLVVAGFAGQIVVARDDLVVFSAAYGTADPHHRVPVTSETGFDIASVTKAFTAVAVLRLRDEGRLSLASTLGEHFRGSPEDKRAITVEQLLGHVSGLGSTYAADGEADRGAAVRKLLLQPLAAPPGQAFRYSDDGYVLLAAVVEAVSDRPYEDYIREKVVKPGGLRHTTFWGSSDFTDPGRVACLQRKLDSKLLARHWGQQGSGGIISTADDLHTWWLSLRGGRLLAPSSVDELIKERRKLKDGTGVGYGWFWSPSERGTRCVWSRGNEDFGHNAIVAVYPDHRLTITITSHRFSGDEPWSRRAKAVIEEVILKAAEPPAGKESQPSSPS